MKTTFDLPQSLVDDVKRIAKQRGTTAREIVRQALTRVVNEDAEPAPFVLVDRSVSGAGISAEFAAMTWSEILEASYGDRGLK